MSEAWPTDDDLATLNSEVRVAAIEAIFKAFWDIDFEDATAMAERINEDNYENVIANDPAAIRDLFESYRRIQDSIPLLEKEGVFDEIKLQLESWEGLAAEGFRIHVGKIRNFLDDQAMHFEEMMGCINGAYELSVEARKSYRSLAEETIRVLEKYESTEQGSTSMVVISIVIGIAAGALSVATGSVGAVVLGGLAGGIGAAGNAVTSPPQPVGGSDPLEMMESYFDALEIIERNLNEEAATLTRNFQEVTGWVDNVDPGSNISSPLPIVDSYDDFQSPFRPSGGGFDARVQEQLDQLAGQWAAAEGTHSDIQRALDGG